MTPELLQTLLRWLVSEDPVQVAHATWRLAQPDTLEPGSKPAPAAITHAPKGCCNG